jgi:NAD(P)-dependent dehydrogenase (short-subunit alcohol dehydrogenase family)
MKRFEGRVAVVTGAASGIGRGTSLALAERGCDLALADVNEQGLKQTASAVEARGRRASVHVVDVARLEQVQALAEDVIREHGHVHIAVNNAGVTVGGTLEEQSFEDWEWIVGINFWGVLYGCKVFVPLIRREDEGHVVNVSSMLGFIGVPGQSSYCATKFAVRGLSEALYAELSGTNIGVTSVHPGAVSTGIVAGARNMPEGERKPALESLARGMAPEQAGRLIVRAIEKNKLRLRIRPESYLSDWLKRLLPVGTLRALGWLYRRSLVGGVTRTP